MSSPDGAVTLLLAEAGDASAQHSAVLGRLVEQHDGQVVKEEAGAAMCSFASAHSVFAARSSCSGPSSSAPLRIGLHAGFVMADESDFYGRNVVLVARIADHAEPGEILASAMLREYTATDPSFEFEPRGEQHFKGLLGEHPVFAVSWS